MPLRKVQLMEVPGGPGVTGAVKAGTGISISADGTISSTITPGVTKLIAGTNVTLSPASGLGDVTINASGGTITGVTAGTNLTGGGSTGNVTLNLADNVQLTQYLSAKNKEIVIGSILAGSQGGSLVWNVDNSSGSTFLCNYAAAGTGGFTFTDVNASGQPTRKLATMNSGGTFFYNNAGASVVGFGSQGELSTRGSSGSSGQILVSRGAGAPPEWVDSPIPSGTSMVFYQVAAPVGWTKVTDPNLSDCALRLVTSTGASVGGTIPFSTFFNGSSSYTGSVTFSSGQVGNTTLSEAQLASHFHYIISDAVPGSGTRVGQAVQGTAANSVTESTGGGQVHNHSLSGSTANGNFTSNFAIKYADVIVCTKS